MTTATNNKWDFWDYEILFLISAIVGCVICFREIMLSSHTSYKRMTDGTVAGPGDYYYEKRRDIPVRRGPLGEVDFEWSDWGIAKIQSQEKLEKQHQRGVVGLTLCGLVAFVLGLHLLLHYIERYKNHQQEAPAEKASMASPSAETYFCPNGHGPLKGWCGEPRCWTCGWTPGSDAPKND